MDNLLVHIAAASLLPLLTIASAQAAVRVTLEARGSPNANYDGSDPLQLSHSISSDVSSAGGSVALNTGSMISSISSANNNSATANTSFNDTITFSGATTGFAYLDYSWSGSIDLSPTSLVISSVGFGVSIVHNGFRTEYSYVLASKECFRFLAATKCTEGNSINTSGSIPIPFDSGSYFISISFGASGASRSISGQANSFLRTTGGISFNSQSGNFLTDASPISQVPEPNPSILLLSGATTLLIAVKKRRQLASRIEA